MVRVAIVEDSVLEAEKLKEMLNLYSIKNSVIFQVKYFAEPTEFLLDYKPEYDIIFMDIEMPIMDGMTASKKLRKIDKHVVLIFVTNMSQFALQGYDVEAFDFIVKPLNHVSFAQKLSRALLKVNEKPQEYISIKSNGNNVRLAIQEIYFIEVNGHQVTYHTVSGDIEVRDTLTAMEERFSKLPLVRCNNCFIVNLQYVSGFAKDTINVESTTLIVSRSKKKYFMKRLANYINDWR